MKKQNRNSSSSTIDQSFEYQKPIPILPSTNEKSNSQPIPDWRPIHISERMEDEGLVVSNINMSVMTKSDGYCLPETLYLPLCYKFDLQAPIDIFSGEKVIVVLQMVDANSLHEILSVKTHKSVLNGVPSLCVPFESADDVHCNLKFHVTEGNMRLNGVYWCFKVSLFEEKDLLHPHVVFVSKSFKVASRRDAKKRKNETVDKTYKRTTRRTEIVKEIDAMSPMWSPASQDVPKVVDPSLMFRGGIEYLEYCQSMMSEIEKEVLHAELKQRLGVDAGFDEKEFVQCKPEPLMLSESPVPHFCETFSQTFMY